MNAAFLGAAIAVAAATNCAQAVSYRLNPISPEALAILAPSHPAEPADLVGLAPAGYVEGGLQAPMFDITKNAKGAPGVRILGSGLQRTVLESLPNGNAHGGSSAEDDFWSNYLRHEILDWATSHLDHLGTSSLWDHTSLWWLKRGDSASHKLYHSFDGGLPPYEPNSVPDSGSTVALLAVAAAGIGILRRSLGTTA
jgi:hypothetical protein